MKTNEGERMREQQYIKFRASSSSQKYRHHKNKRKGGRLCPICGFCASSLGSHFFKFHNITAEEYRIKNRLLKNHTLTSPSLHTFFVNLGKQTQKDSPAITKENCKEYTKLRKPGKSYCSKEARILAGERGKKFIHLTHTIKCREQMIKTIKENYEMGYINPIKGKKRSQETREKIKAAVPWGKDHHMWRGGITKDKKEYLKNWKLKNVDRVKLYRETERLKQEVSK